MNDQREIFVSVDIETAGPIPGDFSLLSIGACVVDDKSLTFACELKPLNRNADPMALKVSGLSLETLERTGLAPEEAMKRFANWLKGLIYGDEVLVFVGFNAPFDWSFVNYYFHKFFGENPFGLLCARCQSLLHGCNSLSMGRYSVEPNGCRITTTAAAKPHGPA